MNEKEIAEMTRLWWKLMEGQADAYDVKRYRELRARSLKEKGEYATDNLQEEPKGGVQRPVDQ